MSRLLRTRPAPLRELASPRGCARQCREEHRTGCARRRRRAPPPRPPRTKWTRRVPHPVLIGHAASLTPYQTLREDAGSDARLRTSLAPPKDETCPVSTGGRTRLVRLVRRRRRASVGASHREPSLLITPPLPSPRSPPTPHAGRAGPGRRQRARGAGPEAGSGAAAGGAI